MKWYRHVDIEKIKKLSYMLWMRELLTKISLAVRDLNQEEGVTRREWWESFAFMLIQIVFLPITVVLFRWYLIDSYKEYGLAIDDSKNILIMDKY